MYGACTWFVHGREPFDYSWSTYDGSRNGVGHRVHQRGCAAHETYPHHALREGCRHTIRSVRSDGQETLFEFSLEEGKIKYTITGESAQGEEGSAQAAWLLVEYLDRIGARWSVPQVYQGKEKGIDWVAVDADDDKQELRMQVVRALSDEKVWKTLAQEGTVTGEASLRDPRRTLSHNPTEGSEVRAARRHYAGAGRCRTRYLWILRDRRLAEDLWCPVHDVGLRVNLAGRPQRSSGVSIGYHRPAHLMSKGWKR